MNALLALSRAIDRMNEIIGKVVGYAILVAILVSAVNAIVRKVLNTSSNSWLELQWYLFGAAFLGAAAYTLKQGEHVRIDIVYARWSRRVQHWIDLLGHLLFLMPFCLLMLYYLWPWAMRSLCIGQNEFCRIEVSTNAGGLVLWPAKLLLVGGFFLLSLQGVSEIIKKIAVMLGLMEDPNPFISSHEAAEAEAKALIEEIKQ
ncbi:TRAP transporter small permease subunit [Pseudogemmobacter sonorensis]|uniref:TRAP transporter small permease subunit n=1 Tax=Pseudogemmobacter sonorensis TaxID=2989681 RepID=UPI0036C00994